MNGWDPRSRWSPAIRRSSPCSWEDPSPWRRRSAPSLRPGPRAGGRAVCPESPRSRRSRSRRRRTRRGRSWPDSRSRSARSGGRSSPTFRARSGPVSPALPTTTGMGPTMRGADALFATIHASRRTGGDTGLRRRQVDAHVDTAVVRAAAEQRVARVGGAALAIVLAEHRCARVVTDADGRVLAVGSISPGP